MKYYFMPFWGVPCCEGLSSQRLRGIWLESPELREAQSPIQADLLFVVGHITHKQSPYLQSLWAQFTYPARCVHILGCKSVLQRYALVEALEKVVQADYVLGHCQIDQAVIAGALKSLGPKIYE